MEWCRTEWVYLQGSNESEFGEEGPIDVGEQVTVEEPAKRAMVVVKGDGGGACGTDGGRSIDGGGVGGC